MIAYLLGCLTAPATAGASFDIGGVEIMTCRELMLICAKVRGLRRWIIPVPVLTPRPSASCVNLLTPVPRGLVFPLVEARQPVHVGRFQEVSVWKGGNDS